MASEPTSAGISVGLPVYNGGAYLHDALEALSRQSKAPFELIISDNGSTDDTQAICQAFAAKVAWIRYIRQPANRGMKFNFKFVLDEARGAYFMWAACDDRWAPDCLATYARVLDERPDVDLVFSNYIIHNFVSGEKTAVFVLPSMLPRVKLNVMTRFLQPIPSLVYGMFRTNRIRAITSTVDIFDFFDLYVGQAVAARAKIYILEDFLYTAGVRNLRRNPRALVTKRIAYLPYYRHTMALLRRSMGLLDFIGMAAVFHRFFAGLVWSTKRDVRRSSPDGIYDVDPHL